MLCENYLCRYWDNDKCILENVSLDVLGVCKDCIYVKVDRDTIDVLRKRELEEEKNI